MNVGLSTKERAIILEGKLAAAEVKTSLRTWNLSF